MSACRSATPSSSVCCQRADRCLQRVVTRLGPRSSRDQRLDALRVLLHGQLGLQPAGQLLGDGQHVLAIERRSSVVGLRRRPRRSRSRPARGKPDSTLSSSSLRLAACSRSIDETGNELGVDAGLLRCPRSSSHDPPPLRVEVGLGEHAGDVRAQLHAVPQELQLRRRCTPARRRRPAARRPRRAARPWWRRRAPSRARRRRGCRPAPAAGRAAGAAARPRRGSAPPGCPGCPPRRRTWRAPRRRDARPAVGRARRVAPAPRTRVTDGFSA